MSFEVKIPSVGESITTGLLSVWHRNEGDFVNIGEPLLTLETDKVSSEITAEQPGILHIKVPAGTDVKIGEIVATIEEGAAAKPNERPMPASGKSEKDKEAEGAKTAEPRESVAVGCDSDSVSVDISSVLGEGSKSCRNAPRGPDG